MLENIIDQPSRIGRVEYVGLWSMWSSIIVLSGVTGLTVFPDDYVVLKIFSIALVVLSLIMLFRIQIKRAHDLDLKGWWALLTLVPYLGIIWLLLVIWKKGAPDTNRFGVMPTNPKPMHYFLVPVMPIACALMAYFGHFKSIFGG